MNNGLQIAITHSVHCSIKSWTIISKLTSTLNLLWIGSPTIRLNRSLLTMRRREGFPDILLVCVEQDRTGTNNHLEKVPRITQADHVGKLTSQGICRARLL